MILKEPSNHRLMENPTLQSLLQDIPVVERRGDWSTRVTSLVTDSRRILPGSLFFALPGLRTSGITDCP